MADQDEELKKGISGYKQQTNNYSRCHIPGPTYMYVLYMF